MSEAEAEATPAELKALVAELRARVEALEARGTMRPTGVSDEPNDFPDEDDMHRPAPFE